MGADLGDLAVRLQGIIDTAIDGIITIDDKGIVETINYSATNQFGYNKSEVIGNNIKMLMPEPYHSEHDGYLHRYVKTKKPRIIGIGREVIGKRKDESEFPFRLAVSEVVLNNRIIFTGIIHDLSDVKTAENELKILNERLEEKVELRTNELENVVNKLLNTNKKLEESEIELNAALTKEKELNELKSRFVSMASHEFRTPLSTIMSSASLISKYDKLDQQENRVKHINRIKSAVNNLTGILNDFLSLSKIEEGAVAVQKSKIDLSQLCNVIIGEVNGMLKKGQTIVYKHEFQNSLITDPRILKNILFNLISNAIKYSEVESEIICKIEESKNYFIFTIEDFGLGIPLEDQKYLFERFFRASNVENIQGTGLGLNIVKRYIQLLNGTINFESEPGKGTKFIVKIPST